MNISPIQVRNTNKPLNFGMLKVSGAVDTSLLKDLTNDNNFKNLVTETHAFGFDTVVGYHEYSHVPHSISICPQDKDFTKEENLKYLNTAIVTKRNIPKAVERWNALKESLIQTRKRESENKLIVDSYNERLGLKYQPKK